MPDSDDDDDDEIPGLEESEAPAEGKKLEEVD